ncbi:unnamed protein product [Vitrella brassicaformis CCMP3155]|uniref:EF-hand domain-containing protein n=3 Tax=Vitrella brassicaformis TaxID=1169539 RepID=A0A0G4EBM4_VITBC|nr:unnamed protein product [Vitrella brassicaformis CCMP3155]|eukprot:CEL92690.1 unnamed protein product [Vitrella brassicaformis CCMP3155]
MGTAWGSPVVLYESSSVIGRCYAFKTQHIVEGADKFLSTYPGVWRLSGDLLLELLELCSGEEPFFANGGGSPSSRRGSGDEGDPVEELLGLFCEAQHGQGPHKTVDLFQVLITLALVSQGEFHEKVYFAFGLLDFDKRGGLTKSVVFLLLMTALKGAYALTKIVPPHLSHVEALVESHHPPPPGMAVAASGDDARWSANYFLGCLNRVHVVQSYYAVLTRPQSTLEAKKRLEALWQDFRRFTRLLVYKKTRKDGKRDRDREKEGKGGGEGEAERKGAKGDSQAEDEMIKFTMGDVKTVLKDAGLPLVSVDLIMDAQLCAMALCRDAAIPFLKWGDDGNGNGNGEGGEGNGNGAGSGFLPGTPLGLLGIMSDDLRIIMAFVVAFAALDLHATGLVHRGQFHYLADFLTEIDADLFGYIESVDDLRISKHHSAPADINIMSRSSTHTHTVPTVSPQRMSIELTSSAGAIPAGDDDQWVIEGEGEGEGEDASPLSAADGAGDEGNETQNMDEGEGEEGDLGAYMEDTREHFIRFETFVREGAARVILRNRQQYELKLRSAFEKYDSDGSGFIDKTEFAAAIQDMMYSIIMPGDSQQRSLIDQIGESIAEQLMREMDESGDEQIDFAEFKTAIAVIHKKTVEIKRAIKNASSLYSVREVLMQQQGSSSSNHNHHEHHGHHGGHQGDDAIATDSVTKGLVLPGTHNAHHAHTHHHHHHHAKRGS